MSGLKVTAITLVLIRLLSSSQGCIDQLQQIHFKAVRCENISAKYIHNITCYAKSFNRSCSTITFVTFLKIPLNKFFIEMDFMYKYGNIYRSAMKLPRFEWCGAFKSGSKSILFQMMIDTFKKSGLGNNVHECPYTTVQVRNGFFVLPQVTEAFFASGDYKIVINGHAGDQQEHFGTITIFTTHNSPNKDTFG